MKKIILFFIIASISHLVLAAPCAISAEEDINYTIDLMLAQAEDFFTALKKGKYDDAWHLLSEQSHKTIIDDVYKTYQNMGGDIQRAAIEQDFKIGGMIFRNYWNAFMQSFDVLMVLEESRWQTGVIEQDKADILITYKDSGNPLELKMVKENDMWKVGLVETFWNTRTMDILQSILKLF